MTSRRAQLGLHGAVVFLCFTPVYWLAYASLTDGLGANPVEKITHVTGHVALRLLLLTLLITPLRKLTRWRGIAPYRRSFGLCAFSYVCLHLATYVGFDLGFAFSALGEDILERPYITVGFTAFCLLVPLAATSTRASIKRLGRRWVSIHRLIYAAAICAVIHFFWLVKADNREPLLYGGVLALLLAARALPARQTTGRLGRERPEPK